MDFIRFETLIGKDNFDYLKNIRIVIVGIGGVGGYALESLVRCGIENFLIIDYDKVDASNKNRQIIADDETVGKFKTKVFKDRISKINKSCKVDIENTFLNEENLNIILDYKPDYVIDACDSINTKINLIINKEKYNYKLISCMGTAKKVDPTKLCITTLDKTSYDHLAKTVRKKLRCLKYNRKVMVVSSIEQTIECDTLGSFMMVPATAGILCAKYVIDDIIKSN